MPPEPNRDLAAAVERVREIFQFFEKTLRAYRMYDAGHPTIAQFEKTLFEKISAFLAEESELTLAVKPYEFHFAGEAVYHNTDKQENVSFRLHQDGVRQLSFLDGLAAEELTRFLGILRTNFESYEHCDDDAVTLLWKAGFEHIPYIVVETFLDASEETEDIEVALARMTREHFAEKPLDSLASLLSGNVPAVRRRLKRADAEEIMNLPDITTDLSTVVGASEGVEKTRAEAAGDDDTIVQRMVLVLFRVLLTQDQPEEFRSVAVVVRRMLDSMLKIGNFGMAAKLYAKLKDLADPAKNPSKKNADLMRGFFEELNGAEMIESLRNVVLPHTFTKFDDLRQFLLTLSPTTTPSLFEIFKSTDRAEIRQAMIPALAAHCEGHLDLFSNVIQGSDSPLALAVLDLFSTVGAARSLVQIKRAFLHKDPHVRSRALDLVALGGAEYAKSISLSALKDSERIIRMKALKLLVDSADRKLAKPLFEFTRASDFDQKDGEEKKQFYLALARLGGGALLNVFRDELKASLLERSEHVVERRVAAVWALHAIGGAEARTAVMEESERKLLPKSLKEACDQVLARWPKESPGA